MKPGDLFPDFKGYGVLCMNRTPLATAYDMEGAFNDLVLTLTRDARASDVIDRLDAVLAPRFERRNFIPTQPSPFEGEGSFHTTRSGKDGQVLPAIP